MKKIFYILQIFLVLFASVSCKKYLEEERFTTVGYNYLATKAGIESGVDAVYNSMRWYMTGENYFCLAEMGVDFTWDGNDGANKTAFGDYLSDLNSANSIISNFWNNNFTAITRANTDLMYLPLVTEMSDDLKAQRRAELLFLRAYYYFDLVQHFGAIPLVTKGNVSEIMTDFKRNPVSEVYKQIISDLRAAYDVLPDVWQQTDRGRATKWAASHLLAKVYLTRISAETVIRGGKATDLDSAAYYAVQVINSGKFILEPDFANYFVQTNQKITKEVIWDVQFTPDPLFNEAPASNYRTGGNQIHSYWVMEYSTRPGMVRDAANEAPFKRIRPNPTIFSNLWDQKFDSRFYKSFKWVFYSNNALNIPVWKKEYYYINPATNLEDKSDVIYTTPAALVGKPKFQFGDSAIYSSPKYYGALSYYTVKNPKQTILNAGKYRQMLIDIAKQPYALIPMDYNSPLNFPSLSKHFDNELGTSINARQGHRNFVRMRLAETYLIAGEAYGRKGDWPNALKYINVVRKRASFADGEMKPAQVYQIYGAPNNTNSTSNNMLVTQTDVMNPKYSSGVGFDPFVDWMLDERGRELFGELNRWEDLVRTGTLVERVLLYNPDAAPYIKDYHKLRPIPNSFIDRLSPKPPMEEIQNPGYY
ncbi:MAG TPA: RagB/SusD family nutrient uptake outer membrane protein [Bacteroidales bacterium]